MRVLRSMPRAPNYCSSRAQHTLLYCNVLYCTDCTVLYCTVPSPPALPFSTVSRCVTTRIRTDCRYPFRFPCPWLDLRSTIAFASPLLFLCQGVSEAWEVWEMPLLIHPCYLLRRKGRVGGDRAGGAGTVQGAPGNGGTEDYGETSTHVFSPRHRGADCRSHCTEG